MATQRRRTSARRRRPAVAGLSGRTGPPAPPQDTASRGGGTTGPRQDIARRGGTGPEPGEAHGAAEPVAGSGGDEQAGTSRGSPDEPTSEPVRRGRRPRRKTVVRLLVAVTLLCGGLAVGLGGAAHGLRSGAAARNDALVDLASTRQVSEQVTNAIRTAFSYDHADPAATQQHAQQVLAGDAVRQYNGLFEQVKQAAPAQRLTFTSTVRAIGTTHLDGDRARLLVFVDQQGVRADTAQRRSGSAQLEISARRFGDRWKISGIKVL